MSLYFLTLGQPVLQEGASTDEFGAALAGNADIDGDGLPELVVGAPGASTLYVYNTTGSGLDTTAVQSLDGEASTDRLGAALVLHDLDGDGDDEAAVGAPSGGVARRELGWAYLYTEHDASAADWDTFGGRDEDHLGLALLGGDFTGDGYGDLLVGSRGYVSESAVQLFASSAGALGTVTDGVIDDSLDTLALAPAGDIDNDGDDDFFAAYAYTDLCADPRDNALLVAGDPLGFGGWVDFDLSAPLTGATLGDIYGSGQLAITLAADGGAWVHVQESDGDNIPPQAPGDWADCDDADATRNPVTVETDGDGIDSDCDGSDDVSVRANEACPDLGGDPAQVLAWAQGVESGGYGDNADAVLAVLEEAYALGCVATFPADAASVATSEQATADCDEPVIAGFTWSDVSYSYVWDGMDCYDFSDGGTTHAVTLERDSGDTAEPAAMDGWVREAGGTTESGGWVRWQDGTLEPVRAVSYEYEYALVGDDWRDEYYEAILPLADCNVTLTRETYNSPSSDHETTTITSETYWWVYEDSYSQELACGFPGLDETGTRVTTPSGSTWYMDSALTTPYPDADADGWPVDLGDCDDANPLIYPCAEEDGIDDVDDDCNGYLDHDVDGDGVLEQYDCDDADASVGRREDRFVDGDNDGWGDEGVDACPDEPGTADRDGDCDDTDPLINPDAIEVCDGIDNNCNGDERDDPVGGVTMYRDGDYDGYGEEPGATLCPGEEPYSEVPGDCDDTHASINPGAVETYDNTVDENCDGIAILSAEVTAAKAPPPDHSDTRGCLGSFAFLLLPLSSLARRRRP